MLSINLSMDHECGLQKMYGKFPELTHKQCEALIFWAMGGDIEVIAAENNNSQDAQRKLLSRAKIALGYSGKANIRSIVLFRFLFSR